MSVTSAFCHVLKIKFLIKKPCGDVNIFCPKNDKRISQQQLEKTACARGIVC